MYFHWRTQRAAGCLGEIVLKSLRRVVTCQSSGEVSQLTRRASLVYLRAADGTDTL
jgi:hypothetical protein